MIFRHYPNLFPEKKIIHIFLENLKHPKIGRNGRIPKAYRGLSGLISNSYIIDFIFSLGELLIAGFLYSIDLENMSQARRNEPQRRRLIKRDLITNVADKKGVAGIRTSTTNTVDDLANRMSNVQLVGNVTQPTQSRPTLRNLVDLGAASTGANISLSNDDGDEDDDSNVV